MTVGLYCNTNIQLSEKEKKKKIPKFQNPVENHRKRQNGYHYHTYTRPLSHIYKTTITHIQDR